MARSKSTLNKLIDESMGSLIEKHGREGFGYDEITMRVRTALGDSLDSALRSLGEERLKERIRERASRIATTDLSGGAGLHPQLDLGDAALVYPVKQTNGVTRFKRITHLTSSDMSHVISVYINQRKGMTKHIQALRKIERKLMPHWKEHPDWTLEEVQTLLDKKAA